ncbi:hypothetical protein C8R46DRAFT_444865 [Mycena filopes]|nr:hypothetical protein C8R46DRAFT_444865 [Mycena filopes]
MPRTPPEDAKREKDSKGWFFRGVSGSPGDRGRLFRAGGGGGGGVGRDGAAAEGAADVREDGRPYTPSPHGEGKEGKTKLVKRRSLGFVQIRRGIRPLNGHGDGEGEVTPTANNVHTTTANASPSKGYGILGVGRPSGAAVGSVEDLGRQKEKEREGMGFVERNVRRISLVGAGRHKRTKSGVSISALGISGDEKENDGKGKKPGSGLVVNATAKPSPSEPMPPPTPPVDVHLQPPSPPQTVRSTSGSMATMKASAPIPIASSRNLDAPPLAFSPTYSLASSPASVGLASPISMASSSTPSLRPYSASSTSPSHSTSHHSQSTSHHSQSTSHHSHSTSPSPKPPLSPNSASLGRSAVINPAVSAAAASPVGSGVGSMRRNSLGDLKIPARISQAQVGLRRDLGMVREFARNVEELKELQDTYQTLVMEVQGILDLNLLHASQPKEREKEKEKERVASPTFFKRHRSNTSSSNPNAPSPQQVQQQAYKQLASAFYGINSKYRISWECAELLIELGGGGAASPPPTSTSAPAMQSAGGSDGLRGKSKARERAITLQDDTKVPPPPLSPGLSTANSLGAIPAVPSPPIASPPSNLAWRASTGRNDLSQRQLLLLKEMLGSPGGHDDSFAEDIPEEVISAAAASTNTVNREWRWGDAMNSTVTLPSEESGVQGGVPGKEKKRRSSRMRMSGIREMLRSLKKGGAPPVPVSTTSVSTESSGDLHAQHLYQHRQVPTTGKQQRRRAKTSAGPESVSVRSTHRPMSPFDPPSLKTASPRRPSLASIFRIGKSNKTPPPSAAADISLDSPVEGGDIYPTFSGISGGRESASNSTGDEEEDWDRMEDSASDVEAVAIARRGGSTIRGRSPYLHSSFLTPSTGRPTTPLRSPSGSRTSLTFQDPAAVGAPARATRLSNVEEHVDPRAASKAESPSRQFSRSRRGGKTGSVRSMPPATLPDPKLAMTPENIKPLLENAREVHARLSDCIAEIRSLLAARP